MKQKLQQFYTFSSAVKHGTSWISSSDRFPDGIIVNCDVCGVEGVMRLPRGKRPRVGLHITRPGSVDDIISLGMGIHAVSKSFREAFRKHCLTGASFLSPAEIVLEKTGPRYEATRRLIRELDLKILYVTGRGGSVAADPRIKKEESCPACGWEYWEVPWRAKRPILVPNWDGSDFFYVDEWTPVLFTERAAALLSGAALSNFGAEKTAFVAPPKSKRSALC